jgi:hypothetical protein
VNSAGPGNGHHRAISTVKTTTQKSPLRCFVARLSSLRDDPIVLFGGASLVRAEGEAIRCAVWFVSYIAPDMSGAAPRPARRTKTFASEAEAKQFAKSRAEAGDKTVIAGTVNPTVPRRVISSTSMSEWLGFSPPTPNE